MLNLNNMGVFSNLPSDSSLPEIGMSDPNNTEAPNQSAGGKTKISPTDLSGPSGTPMHSVNGEQVLLNGDAPSGENSSGIPAATPITPLTYGDPNNTEGGVMPGNYSGKL
jgi:hypothetical protein